MAAPSRTSAYGDHGGPDVVAVRGAAQENAWVVMRLRRELAAGTLASVLRQAGIEAEELRTSFT
ncbi:hypothetical protein CcI49_15665 [Frankia sp. CcI49]|nr:hypothetical protein CcI49_15665 [Frankia sp. CcI49]